MCSNRKKQAVLNKLQNKLIVSCQARVGWAMYGSDIMAAFAKAAEEGGAAGIRATGADNITKIKEKVDLPIIGINKQFGKYPVYITPTYQSAKEILDCGIDVIALDATSRLRPNGETLETIVEQIRLNYPDVLIMGEISTLEEAKAILPLKLIHEISQITAIPIIAEGKIKNEVEAQSALDAGAFAVVVGTSITRPEIITSRYVTYLKEHENI